MILLISGAPGSGRTTLQKILYVKYGVKRIVTTTTRPPRPGEVEGVSYKFVSEEQFDSIDFCDKIEYSGYRYGLPERDLLSVPFSELGSVVLNSHGVFNVSNFCYEYKIDFLSIYLKAPLGVLRHRIIARKDAIISPEQLRIQAEEISGLNSLDFDYVCDSSQKNPFEIADDVMAFVRTRVSPVLSVSDADIWGVR